MLSRQNVTPPPARAKLAFSLVELSIVLVILGLLMGGVLTGQSLIRAAQLRSVTNDLQRHHTAVMSFRDKYFGFPGDITNATQFWGSAGGTGADAACYNTLSTTAATCNGDGNGYIDTRIASLGAGYQLAEAHRGWQQLANAGLIEGLYQGSPTSFSIIGLTSPAGKLSSTGFDIVSVDFNNFFEYFSTADYGNTIFFGTNNGDTFRGAALTPSEAWNIDTKIDDGKPDTGKLTSSTMIPACYTGAYPSASYALTTTSLQCALRYGLR